MNAPQSFGPGCPWYSWLDAFGPANVKWCEERLCSWFNEPANTWSNLGYLAIAAIILVDASRIRSTWARRFGWACFFTGFFSLAYHASNNFLTQVFDFLGMFLYTTLLIALNLVRLGKLRVAVAYSRSLGASAVLTLAMPVLHFSGVPIQGAVAVLALLIAGSEVLIVARRSRLAPEALAVRHRYFLASSALLLAGLYHSSLDLQRVGCDPSQHGWFSQGHALWHWLAAAGMGMSYVFFRPALPDFRPTLTQH